MTNAASWGLLSVGVAGLVIAAGLGIHFFTHRDRRRGDRRHRPWRGRQGARSEAELQERRTRDRRFGGD